MKTMIYSVVITMLVGYQTHAAELAANVIAERTTYVAFAPPERRGHYKFQITNLGNIIQIDNKNKVTKMGKLSANLVAKLRSKIDQIASDALINPTEPPCYDAPSIGIDVRQSSGKTMQIWKREGCRDFMPTDAAAISASDAVGSLYKALNVIERFE